MKYFEVEFEDTYSIACRGVRVPSIEEATQFCRDEVKEFGDIVSVTEIPLAEVIMFFDSEDIDNWPIFE